MRQAVSGPLSQQKTITMTTQNLESKMKVVLFEKSNKNSPFRTAIADIPEPSSNEVLVKVTASSLNTGDVVRMKIRMLKKKAPITGSEFSGTVIKTGSSVSRFKVGEEVFGYVSSGAHAEYLAVPENGVINLKPSVLDHGQAAGMPNGLLSALYFIRKSGLQKGQKVLIYGASGSVGTNAVQIAKSLGAEIHAVCGTANIEMVKILGASRVFDYTKEDYSRSGERYDIIFDAVNKTGFHIAQKALVCRGKFLTVGFNGKTFFQMLFNFLRYKQVITGIASHKGKDLALMSQMANEKSIKPVIDRSYEMDQMQDAFNYVKSGKKIGNVIIQIA